MQGMGAPPVFVFNHFDQIVRVMAQSRSTSTTKAYLQVIKKFLEWCKSRKLSVQLPFSVSTVSLYLFEIHQSCASSASMIQAHAALKWFHSFVPSLDRNPLDSEFCKNIIESAKRTKSKLVTKKKPFSSQIIKAILDSHNKEDASLKDLRVAALCSLAFAGFFRYNELCNIVPRIEANSNLPLFRPLVFHRSNTSYTLRDGKISYTSCREILRGTSKQLGFNPDDYGLHSLRSGGITSVVRNSCNSISERLFKLHGRWRTDTAKDMYVEESLDNRLLVTKYLGL